MYFTIIASAYQQRKIRKLLKKLEEEGKLDEGS
ncbi:MAG: hypothetical protein Sv326_1345 (plasmid) [Candidatus Fermentimicrarchaeum limneticum]|uniref:Uncharacterized protein n=1 Tax=Fermentimicrarchaeum limneticum TaxID=2795018 RepID=A0A7D6BGJ5_FERL1|nr:MAG: hypothetical protein Sv326_1345 [Candidatus Fermentimicrarchaeum limneticum]